jgi:hypothetical protein
MSSKAFFKLAAADTVISLGVAAETLNENIRDQTRMKNIVNNLLPVANFFISVLLMLKRI